MAGAIPAALSRTAVFLVTVYGYVALDDPILRYRSAYSVPTGDVTDQRHMMDDVMSVSICEDCYHKEERRLMHVLAYNLKRVIRILGFAKTMRAMKLAGA